MGRMAALSWNSCSRQELWRRLAAEPAHVWAPDPINRPRHVDSASTMKSLGLAWRPEWTAAWPRRSRAGRDFVGSWERRQIRLAINCRMLQAIRFSPFVLFSYAYVPESWAVAVPNSTDFFISPNLQKRHFIVALHYNICCGAHWAGK